MTTADQLAIVRAKLGNDPHIDPLVLADGGLVQGWMKSRRLLVLLSHSSSTSSSRQSRLTSVIGIFVSTSFPVSAAKDLTLETLLPMDLEFKIEIDSGDDAILMKMSNAKHKFMFEMLPGYHTQNFVSEIFRQTESNGKQTEPRDFSWTTQYLPQSSGKLDSLFSFFFYPKILPRIVQQEELNCEIKITAILTPTGVTILEISTQVMLSTANIV